MSKIIAVPDIHGCYTLLTQLLEKHLNSGAEMIFLGDYIDRSPESFGDRKVIKLLQRLQREPDMYGLSKVTLLRGNHEQLLIDAFKRDLTGLWLQNGGNRGFLDYCRSNPSTIRWMKSLPLYAIRGKYLFVHAGVRPGVDIKEQSKHDLLWIREPFSDHPHGLPYTVVHGHQIQWNVDEPVVTDDRISMDLGAFYTGNLASMELTV